MREQQYALSIDSSSEEKKEFGLFQEEEKPAGDCYHYAYQNAEVFLELNNIHISDPEPYIRPSALILLKKRKDPASSADVVEHTSGNLILTAESRLLLRRKLVPKKLTLNI